MRRDLRVCHLLIDMSTVQTAHRLAQLPLALVSKSPPFPVAHGSLCKSESFATFCDGKQHHLAQLVVRLIIRKVDLVEAGMRCRQSALLVRTGAIEGIQSA